MTSYAETAESCVLAQGVDSIEDCEVISEEPERTIFHVTFNGLFTGELLNDVIRIGGNYAETLGVTGKGDIKVAVTDDTQYWVTNMDKN